MLHAAELLDGGGEARLEVSAIKVVCAEMVHDVVDRAMQVYGGEGMTDATPLNRGHVPPRSSGTAASSTVPMRSTSSGRPGF